MQCLAAFYSSGSQPFLYSYFLIPSLSGGLSMSKKAAKAWAENEDQAQNHCDNERQHLEDEGEEWEDVATEINQLLPSSRDTNAPLKMYPLPSPNRLVTF